MTYKKIFCSFLFLTLMQSSCLATAPNTFIAFISGFNNPVDIATTPSNLFAYVTDGGSNSVLVIDTNQSSPTFNTLIAAPSLNGVFNNPADLAITPNSNFAYVCDAGSNSVLVINTNPASPSFNTLIAAPGLASVFNQPNSIAITPNGLFAYVTNAGNNNLSVIDINPSSLTYNTVLVTPGLNGILSSPFAIVITPSGNYAYISNLTGSVGVVDTNPSSLTYNTLLVTPGLSAVNAQPEGLAITANGFFAYVSDGAGTDVSVIDTNPASPTFNTVLSAPNLLSAFNAPNGVATTSDGNYAYVTNFLGSSGSISSVSVIDTNPSSSTYNSTLSTPDLSLSGIIRFVALAATANARFVYAIDAFNNTTDVIYTGIIAAPINFTGCKIKNVFLVQTDLINHLTWSAPTTGALPVAYNIYRDAGLTQLVATVPATSILQYNDHNRLSTANETYYLVSVDSGGNLSAPVSTTVSQSCSNVVLVPL